MGITLAARLCRLGRASRTGRSALRQGEPGAGTQPPVAGAGYPRAREDGSVESVQKKQKY